MKTHTRIANPSSTMRKVADFVLKTPASAVPDTAKDQAALLLLDTLGVSIAAAPMQVAQIARETAFRIYGSGDGARSVPLLFDGRPVSAAGAAFAAATQIDNLDAHDGYNPVKGHIGAAVVPGLIAMSHSQPDLSGGTALAAMCIGYDIAGRAGLALHDSVADYHTSGAWNALGVAALGARLWSLDAAALRQALGIAEYHGPRSQMMREIANPTMLHDGSGQGAQVGVSAVVMASLGFEGAPAMTVEADEVKKHWQGLGTDWLIHQQYVKPYPICRWAHAPIDGAKLLKEKHGLSAAQIERVEICSFANAVSLFPDVPETTSQAQYSLPFAVAAMLVHGAVDLRHIEGEGLRDREVARLIAATHLSTSQRHEDRFPSGRWADITVVLKDGTRLNSGDLNARGGAHDPFSANEICEKFHAFADPVLGKTRANAIRCAALTLRDGARPFTTLTDLLWEGGSA